MATPEAFDAFKDYLDGEWTGAPLVYENDLATLPDSPAAWVLVEVFGSFYAQETFGAPGDNLWREGGQTDFHVMTPRDTGSRAGRIIASQLASLFREQGPSGIRIIDMSIGAGEPGDGDGNYFRMSLTVNWQRDS